MIYRLRVKFVVINMTIVVLMMSVVFGLVYHFTRADLEEKSIRMMEKIANRPFQNRASRSVFLFLSCIWEPGEN